MARTDEQDASERDALKALIESDGWRLFERLVDAEWNAEATLARQDEALKAIQRGDVEGISDTVQQIQAARKAVRAVMEKPRRRIEQLQPEKQATGPFAGLRRIGR